MILHDRIRSKEDVDKIRKYLNRHIDRMERNRLMLRITDQQGRHLKSWKECWISRSEEA